MCGIVGFYGKNDPVLLRAMMDRVQHRGPDDEGMWISDSVSLGHKRLSIIDLSSSARQPMTNEDHTVYIVFNGEIYNFIELKNKLKKNHHFISNTDTEVLIHLYEEYGKDLLQYLNGMFSFVIYDQKKEILFGARDRLGEKPLKYYHTNSFFAFASENKSLIPCLQHKPSIDPLAIHHYLTLQYTPAPFTGFQEFKKIPAAHYFILEKNELTIKRYWTVNYKNKTYHTFQEWEDILHDVIQESVLTRLHSDVPLGAFLSGGIDSSTVVAFMAKNLSRPVQTFSIGFDDPRFDETIYASIVSKQYNTDHTILSVDSGMLKESLNHLTDYYDEPIADNSILPTFLLCHLTKKHITVALTGDGGDENFLGYDRYNIVAFSDYYSRFIPSPIRSCVVNPLAIALYALRRNDLTHRIKRFSNTYEQSFYQKYLQYYCFFDNSEKEYLYTDMMKSVAMDDTFCLFQKFYDSSLPILDNCLLTDINTYLPEDLLYKTDYASMATGLELRSPFLNHNLIERVATIPVSYKLRRFSKKWILKKMLIDKNILPPQIVYRKKMGFISPLKNWFRGELRDYVRDTILDSKLISMNIFQKEKLEEYLNNYPSSPIDYSNNLFSLLFLSQWITKYC